MHGYFNGNKYGIIGEYPWQPKQRQLGSGTQGVYKGGTYLGHNIGALAVDGKGEIIDFDFNHNSIFNSSTEHAEVRLIRRIFALSDIEDNWETKPLTKPIPQVALDDNDYSSKLSLVTIYTSLESCAQCSGMMTLANVKQVVCAQNDPTQYQIGRIMYHLSRPVGGSGGSGAPRPISGTEVGFPITEKLEKAYLNFVANAGVKAPKVPFYKPPGTENDPTQWSGSKSITSFLCTDTAYDNYAEARKYLEAMTLEFPSYIPAQSSNGTLTNAQVLDQARKFLNYALNRGNRGTPHR